MKRIRYLVAASLDGYIAGPNGEFDWIVQDPEIDFGAMFAQFDTFLVGRRTFEAMAGGPEIKGKVLVFPGSKILLLISLGTMLFATLCQTRQPHVSCFASRETMELSRKD